MSKPTRVIDYVDDLLYSPMDVAGNRKAVVIYVPFRLRKAFRKIHLRLVRELEKKFSGKVVISDFCLSSNALCLLCLIMINCLCESFNG